MITYYDIIRYNGNSVETVQRFDSLILAADEWRRGGHANDKNKRLFSRSYKKGELNNAAFYEQTMAGYNCDNDFVH